MNTCKNCGSMAINEDEDGVLCDVCYYKISLLNFLFKIIKVDKFSRENAEKVMVKLNEGV